MTSIWIPVISGAAVILAAMIGFGAAILKHRWDVASEAEKWLRERGERLRLERLDSLTKYLAARPTLTGVRATAQAANQSAALLGIYHEFKQASYRLQIVSGESTQLVAEVVTDTNYVLDWITNFAENSSSTEISACRELIAAASDLTLAESWPRK